MNMGSKTATARIHCRPTINDKTAAALIEMMSVAASQLYGYEGPIEVEIHPDRDPLFETYEPPPNDGPDWCGPFETDNPQDEDFFYAQHMF